MMKLYMIIEFCISNLWKFSSKVWACISALISFFLSAMQLKVASTSEFSHILNSGTSHWSDSRNKPFTKIQKFGGQNRAKMGFCIRRDAYLPGSNPLLTTISLQDKKGGQNLEAKNSLRPESSGSRALKAPRTVVEEIYWEKERISNIGQAGKKKWKWK